MSGSVVAAVIFSILMEVLRFVEQPMNLLGLEISGIPGMRMVIFSLGLLLIILFYRRGLMGTNEFNWNWVLNRLGIKTSHQGKRGEAN